MRYIPSTASLSRLRLEGRASTGSVQGARSLSIEEDPSEDPYWQAQSEELAPVGSVAPSKPAPSHPSVVNREGQLEWLGTPWGPNGFEVTDIHRVLFEASQEARRRAQADEDLVRRLCPDISPEMQVALLQYISVVKDWIGRMNRAVRFEDGEEEQELRDGLYCYLRDFQSFSSSGEAYPVYDEAGPSHVRDYPSDDGGDGYEPDDEDSRMGRLLTSSSGSWEGHWD